MATQPVVSVQHVVKAATSKEEQLRLKRCIVMRSSCFLHHCQRCGASKILKVKKRDVLNSSNGERIVVDFDDTDSSIGEGQGILAGFCGILATDCYIFPIHFEKRPDLHMTIFNRCFDRFIKVFLRTTESNAIRYVYNSMCKKWGAKRLKLFDKVYDPLKSKAEIMDSVPLWISPDQWISYVDYRYKEKTHKTCKRNTEIRKKQTVSHIGGSKPNSRRMAEMMANFISLHIGMKMDHMLMRRQKRYVKIISGVVGTVGTVEGALGPSLEKIELALSQSTMDESEISPNDVVGTVLGKEHSGRVRCIGLRVVPEKYNQMLNAHNQSQENYREMMNVNTQMMNAFKAYVIMKEGKIPEEFAGIFVSPPRSTPSDAASGSISPMDIRRSSGGSNPNDNH
ncbi:uncharacterized protein LOC142173549 [Nicotiana tabacum]|uniref:Uncharacterized protein LOC142173549 n=1 Tax=Nicotiana tabacum TaxID=4097 RepID=A0AC58TDF0_TOBAC